MGRAAAIVMWMLACGCLEPSSLQCEDGRTCQGGTTCDVTNRLCVPPAQADACRELHDGNSCRFSTEFGVCNGGTCVPTTWTATSTDSTPLMTPPVRDIDDGGPQSVAVDGLIRYISDSATHRIWRLDATTGVITTAAGTGSRGFFGDGGVATSAGLNAPAGVAVDGLGNLYIADTANQRIRRVEATTGVITTVAGNGDFGYGGDDGPAPAAQFRNPAGLYLDDVAHVLYVADTGNHVIRAIDLASSMVRVAAGTPATRGFFGDGAAATRALLYEPQAITRCANGDLMIADTGNHRVRRVAAGTSAISTVLGDGSVSSAGEGRPASIFAVNQPLGLACDAIGNLYVTSTTAVREVAANANGIVDGSGLVQTIYGAPPRETFPASVTRCLTGLAVVDATDVQVVDSCTGLLVNLERGPKP